MVMKVGIKVQRLIRPWATDDVMSVVHIRKYGSTLYIGIAIVSVSTQFGVWGHHSSLLL